MRWIELHTWGDGAGMNAPRPPLWVDADHIVAFGYDGRDALIVQVGTELYSVSETIEQLHAAILLAHEGPIDERETRTPAQRGGAMLKRAREAQGASVQDCARAVFGSSDNAAVTRWRRLEQGKRVLYHGKNLALAAIVVGADPAALLAVAMPDLSETLRAHHVEAAMRRGALSSEDEGVVKALVDSPRESIISRTRRRAAAGTRTT